MHRFLTLSLAALLGLGLAGCPWVPSGDVTFTSADRFSNSYWGLGATMDGVPGDVPMEGDAEGETQREVVEPDVIRQVGDLLYVLNQHRGLSIVDLAGEAVLAQLPTYGYPRDLYLVGDRAYVLVGYAQQAVAEGNTVRIDVGSRLYVADVSDPAAAEVVASFDLTGDFIDSRLVGDVLYAVSAQYTWDVVGVAVDKQQTSESWVTSIAVGDPANIAVVDELAIPGAGNSIQVTPEAIFVASAAWYRQDGNVTTISCIDISDPAGDIAAGGSVVVPGYVADQYKMDAWNGVLRVVSNTNWPDRDVYVTTVSLDDLAAPAIVGQTRIENAAGETLYAVRFDGPRAYVVTYLQVDPLFVIDLSDPANPVVAGELMVPGWSTHIEIVDGRLVALGVDDTDGRRVKVSLYDVDDPAAPAEVDTVSFGEGWAWSSAFSDVKAFTVLDDVLIVPTSGYDNVTGRFDRLQFLSWSPDGLGLRGAVDVRGDILRSFRYGDRYYGVTTEQVAVIDAADLDAPAVVNAVTLAEYCFDYFELDGNTRAAVVAHLERNEAVVRTEDADGAVLGEVTVKAGSLNAAEVVGSRVVLVGTTWDETTYETGYTVTVVDCADPAAPVVAAEIPLDFTPWWGWCYWCGYPEIAVDMDGGVAAKQMYDMMWYPYPAEDSALLAGNYLVLRGQAASYDVTVGDTTPQQGLAVIDVAAGALAHTIGLGYEQVVSVDAVGGQVYVGTLETLGPEVELRPECAYYIGELDPGSGSMGALANVPGTFLQYDPASGVLVLQDWQYTGGLMDWTYEQSLRTVIWEGGDVDTVVAVDELLLPDYTGTVLAAGSRVFYQHYDPVLTLAAVEVGAGGALSAGGALDVSASYGYLAAGRDATAYVSHGNAIATYDFSDEPTLTGITEVMGYPLRYRFEDSAAYVPLGYAGLAVLPY